MNRYIATDVTALPEVSMVFSNADEARALIGRTLSIENMGATGYSGAFRITDVQPDDDDDMIWTLSLQQLFS